MNKQKRAIILLQANAMRNTLKTVRKISDEFRKPASELYGPFNTSFVKAAMVVSGMSATKLAVVLRACCEENNYAHCHPQNSYYGNMYSTKLILMAVTSKSWFLHKMSEFKTRARGTIGRFHGYQTTYTSLEK